MVDITQQQSGIPGQISFNVNNAASGPVSLPATTNPNLSMFGRAAAANPYVGAFSGAPPAVTGPFSGAFTGTQPGAFQPQWSAPVAPVIPAYQAPSAPASAAPPPPDGMPAPVPPPPDLSWQAPPMSGGGEGGGEGGGGGDGGDGGGGMARGGVIRQTAGVNPPGPDTGQINAEIGEVVIRKDAVSKYGRAVLLALNSGKIDPAKLRRLLPKK